MDANNQKKQIVELLTVANEFCMFIEKAYDYPREDILQYVHRIAPLLYLKGALLPEVAVTNPEMNERFYTEEEWENLFNAMRKIIGKDDIFWYADPGISDELIKGSMSEQMTDVFQDLEDFLLLYQKNSILSKENAVHELGQLFITNWGRKLLRIMPHLHQLRFMQDQPDDEADIQGIF